MTRLSRVLLLGLALALTAGAALAAPKFPAPNGTHVVDQANILSPETEAKLNDELTALEDRTQHQVVVATVSSLQGLEIEDYGYQLGRTWGVGREKEDDGVVLLVAPNERKVRVEVGYGLEPVLTDALSSVIVNQAILPRFKAGDFDGGVTAGTEEIIKQLDLPESEAKAVAAKAKTEAKDGPPPWAFFILLFIVFILANTMRGRRRGGLGSALPWIILGSMGGGGRDRGGWGGGGFGGGGGFSGGGGSFGGGGSSGGW